MNNGKIINGNTYGTSSLFATITPTNIPNTVPFTKPISKLNSKYQKYISLLYLFKSDK